MKDLAGIGHDPQPDVTAQGEYEAKGLTQKPASAESSTTIDCFRDRQRALSLGPRERVLMPLNGHSAPAYRLVASNRIACSGRRAGLPNSQASASPRALTT